MLNINIDTVLVGTSELRTNMPQISKDIKTKKVILVKKGKPFAVLTDFDEYQKKEDLIDTFEDMVLGYIAKGRDLNSTEKDFIDSKKVEKSLGI